MVNVGDVLSKTVIVCKCVVELLQSSEITQVRKMIDVPLQGLLILSLYVGASISKSQSTRLVGLPVIFKSVEF